MSIDVHLRTGRNALQAGDMLTAQGQFTIALQLDPKCFDAACNLSLVFLSTERIEMAEAMARRALKLGTVKHEAFNNLAYILGCAGKFDEAERMIRRALTLNDSPRSWHVLGLVLYSLGRFEESVDAFERELQHNLLDDARVEAIDKRGISLLGCGRYVDGLKDNKIRWTVLAAHPMMHSGIPIWDGESLEGKSIAILHEQGFGDTLQFCRYVPKLREMAARVVLSAPASTLEFFKANNIADEVVNVTDAPDVDYVCPMLTAPIHLGLTEQADIRGEPYLRGFVKTPQLPSGTCNVGIVWGGRSQYSQDKWRSMPVQTMLPLVSDSRARFFSLQADERGNELWKSGMSGWVQDLSPRIRDWNDTAALVQEMDVIVSVDTAVAHLAGAMGRPVALMVPQASCWRWLDHDSKTTPWYDTMRIFRQERQGDWAPVIAGVRDFIDGHV